MAKRFEDLLAWQKARSLTSSIYALTKNGAMSRDFGFRDQIQRASISMMTNIAEGLGYSNPKQFNHYLTISRASSIELQSLLYVALDANYITKDIFQNLYTHTEEVISITSGLQRSLKT